MRVLVIGPSWNKSKGGMATVIQEIKEDLILNEKYNLKVFSSYIDGNKVIRSMYSVLAYIYFTIVFRKYDLFHIHMASYGSTYRKAVYIKFLKKHNKKVILHIHGAEFLVFYSKLNKKRKNLVKNLLDSVDLVIALSDEWKKRFENEFGLKNCVSLNNGINSELYQSAEVDLAQFRQSFLSLGRLGKRKGTYDLLEAIKDLVTEIPDLKLYLAGDGEIEKFKCMINEYNLEKNIEVVGWINKGEKINLLRKVSTVILPSYNEGLPMAILEGMASGKAIISTSVGAIPEVVKDENGILIDAGNVNELKLAIKECYSNVEKLKSMGKKNRSKIMQEYDIKKIHLKLVSYYETIMNQKG